jgi:hypothetical protein
MVPAMSVDGVRETVPELALVVVVVVEVPFGVKAGSTRT